ncbi:MAG: endonuclease MutS2 [Caloramator sp.]|nr:MAG: endonuclease MutS2 [Caloramator sp.]
MILKDTLKNVGMDYVLSILNVRTPYGKERLNSLILYKNEEELNRQYYCIEFLIDFIKKNKKDYNNILSLLEGIKEIRTSIKRAASGSVLDVSELFEIKNFLINVREICKIQMDNNFIDELKLFRIPYLENILDIEGQNSRSFYIYDSYSQRLKSIRSEIKNYNKRLNLLREEIKEKVEQKYGVYVKQNSEIVISRDDIKIQEALFDKNLRQALKTPYYIIFSLEIGDEGDRINNIIEKLKAEEEEEEYRIRTYLTEKIKEEEGNLNKLIALISELDLLLQKAELAIETKSVKPKINSSIEIKIVKGRHLKVEAELKKKGVDYTPISIDLKKGSTIITGVNMGGKTVTLRLIGLLCIMAHMGFFVPCDFFSFFPFEYYFCQAGDMQSLDNGLSTFGAEVLALNEAVKYKDKMGLVLIDEIARGTNPKEGRAILKAILSYFNTLNSVLVVTTHFDGVDDIARHYEVVGLKIGEDVKNISLKDLNLYMDYTLREVYGKYEVPKDAIRVARLLGFEEDILNLAEKYLK